MAALLEGEVGIASRFLENDPKCSVTLWLWEKGMRCLWIVYLSNKDHLERVQDRTHHTVSQASDEFAQAKPC